MGGLVASALAGAIGSGVGAFAAGAAFRAVLSAAGVGAGFGALSFLINKPKKPRAPSLTDHSLVTVNSANPSRKWVLGRRRIGGDVIFIDNEATPNNNAVQDGWLHLVIVLATHPIEEVEEVYINRERVYINTAGANKGQVTAAADLPQGVSDEQAAIQNRYINNAYFEFRLDGASVPFASLNARTNNRWNAVASGTGDKATGCALVYFRALFDRQVYPNGEPSLSFVVKGANDIYDPRTSTTGFSENAALLTAYILERFPLITRKRINSQALVDAANVCDKNVATYTTDGATATEPQYRLSAFIAGDTPAQDIIEAAALSMAGAVFFTNKEGWIIRAGAGQVAVADIDDSIIDAKVVDIKPRVALADRYNTLNAVYVEPDNGWITNDIKPVTNSAYVDADGSKLSQQIELAFVIYRGQCVRIAQQYLRRNRAEMNITIAVNDLTKILDLTVWDNIRLTMADYGIDRQIFKITEMVTNDTDADFAVNLTLQLDDSSSYTYTPNFADYSVVPPAPVSLPSPLFVPTPAGVTLESGNAHLLIGKDGTVINRMQIKWTANNSPFIDHAEIVVTDTTTNEVVQQATSIDNVHYFDDGIHNKVYSVAVSYYNALGIKGAPTTATHLLQGKEAPPSTPTLLNAIQIGDIIEAEVQGVVDRDIDALVFRATYRTFDQGLTGFNAFTNWDDATDLELVVSAKYTPAHRLTVKLTPKRSGYFWLGVKAIDTSGNESKGFATDFLSFAGTNDEQQIFVADYAPGWQLGTATNMVAADNNLLPAGQKTAQASTAYDWIESFTGHISNLTTTDTPTSDNGVFQTDIIDLERVVAVNISYSLHIQWGLNAQSIASRTFSEDIRLRGLRTAIPTEGGTHTIAFEKRDRDNGAWQTITTTNTINQIKNWQTNARQIRARVNLLHRFSPTTARGTFPLLLSSFIVRVAKRI